MFRWWDERNVLQQLHATGIDCKEDRLRHVQSRTRSCCPDWVVQPSSTPHGPESGLVSFADVKNYIYSSVLNCL